MTSPPRSSTAPLDHERGRSAFTVKNLSTLLTGEPRPVTITHMSHHTTPIPTAERLPLMAATLAATKSARLLAQSLVEVEHDDYETTAHALRSIADLAVKVLRSLSAAVIAFDEEHSRPAPAVDDERVNWNLRPADRSVFADGPMSAGFVLVDRRSHSAGDALCRNVDGRERRVAGLIAWSPIRRQWEHWCGGRCSDVDPNVEALSNRHPEAPVHAPAEVDQ